MLGAGCTGAAIALKTMMEETGTPGTIRVFGCASEEAQGAKVYFVRDGLFDDVDVALAWHPAPFAGAGEIMTAANVAVKVRFAGRTAHAGNTPWDGRSALKGAELFGTGIQFMREHMLPDDPDALHLRKCRCRAEHRPRRGADQMSSDLVLAFAHDRGQRLGARLADHQPPVPVQPRLALGDRARTLASSSGAAPFRSGRSSAAAARGEAAGERARRLPPRLDHRGQELQRRDQPVAGGGVVGHHDVARLLAAEVVAARPHRLDHVAVADRVRRSRGPWPARCRSSPRFDITVATSVPFASRPSSRPSGPAISAMIWSPSATIGPRSSMIITRSASPSRLMPRSAPVLEHRRRRRAAARSSRSRR
jgi:hypothetical protein